MSNAERATILRLTAELGVARREAATASTALKNAVLEMAKLRAATNQCRLAFAGSISVQSALDALDALGEKP